MALIRLEPRVLEPAEAYGLAVLLDLARLPAVDDPDADVVQLSASDRSVDVATVSGSVAARWHVEVGDGSVVIPRPVLRQITDIAGAGVEQRATARDRFDRVPSSANPLVAEGLEREAVISRAASVLRNAVLRAAGRRLVRVVAPWPKGCRWAAAFTHDLDAVRWWPLLTALRVAELLRRRDLAVVGGVARAASRAVGRDVIRDGVQTVLRAESDCGVRGTWFILAGTPTARTIARGDLTYRPEAPAARRILDEIVRQGGELGLHGSFATMLAPDVLRAQRTRLGALAGGDIAGVRQHFLRMRPGSTQRAMEAAGFAYDATFGFADRNGFRSGVADVLPSWDDAGQRQTGLDQVPLTWMDRALSKYRGIEQPSTWVDDAIELARECQRTDGLWVGLWHPNLTPALGFPGAPPAYQQLLRVLIAERPFVGTLCEIVRWRRARRAARVRRVSPDGRAVELSGEPGSPELQLEVPSAASASETA